MSQRLAIRATFAFLALPGVVAFAVPLLLLRPIGEGFAPMLLNAPLLVVGCVVLG